MSDPVFRAASHFGLGPRPGELARIARRGARRWLLDQLAAGVPQPAALDAIAPSAETLADMFAFERRRTEAGAKPVASYLDKLRAEMLPQLASRVAAAAGTRAPFRERLVHFWSNHFTVSTVGAQRRIATSCVAYENEAIRARLDGSFAHMLRAVVQHPVMLVYLDNAQSMGPRSPLGRNRQRGLNENLAREILELHTLGVDGGYGQDDVAALARIISGWTVADGVRIPAPAGGFHFLAAGHEPGPQVLLGRTYDQAGVAQGEAALADLARHPSTVRFLARKLAVHFVADRPDEAVVAHLEGVWRDSDGHLPTVHAALVDLPGSLDGVRTKVRSPSEFMIAALRGLDLPRLSDEAVLGGLRMLGQFPFQAPSPAGWPDAGDHWASPNALLQRIDWASQVGVRVGSARDPEALADFMLPADDVATRQAIVGAESPAQGLALLLGAPAFQWR
ncbi:MAG TPA: DUF1800 domain-containing protein [Pseudomonadales bacterium]|nr:DUF1800 domain-containing protein [Pseudomonadales bacterium]